MDLAELRKQPHLSASSINDYIDCGFLYKFGRVDKLVPEFTPDSLIYGSVIHSVLEKFYQERMIGNKLPLKEMQDEFEKQWRQATDRCEKIQYSKGKSFEYILQEGKELLTVYWNKLPEDNFKILAIEESFSFTVEGVPVPVIGQMDLVEEDESGTIIIVDWKTAAKAFSLTDVDTNSQLTTYKMAAKANGFKDREILLRFDVLIKTQSKKFEQYYTTRTEVDERRMRNKILQVWDGINKGVFIPNDGHWKCNGCGFKAHCDEFLES